MLLVWCGGVVWCGGDVMMRCMVLVVLAVGVSLLMYQPAHAQAGACWVASATCGESRGLCMPVSGSYRISGGEVQHDRFGNYWCLIKNKFDPSKSFQILCHNCTTRPDQPGYGFCATCGGPPFPSEWCQVAGDVGCPSPVDHVCPAPVNITVNWVLKPDPRCSGFDPVSTAKAYFDASNLHALDRIRSMFSVDVEYHSNGVGDYYGIEAVMNSTAHFFAAYPLVHWTVLSVSPLPQEPFVILFHYEMRLLGPDSPQVITGREFVTFRPTDAPLIARVDVIRDPSN